MSAPDCSAAAQEQAGAPIDADALIASLRAAGVDRFDPVRFHHIGVLARRASAHQGSIRHLLDAKLAQALSGLKARFEQAQNDASQMLAQSVQQYPHAAGDLERCMTAGDFRQLQRQVAALRTREQCAALGALVRQLAQHAPENAGVPQQVNAGAPVELKALRNDRNTWSKLSVDKQVRQALDQAPANAGPINSHMLVLRSLALMRDIAPDYLNRFMAYADTLLCLDQGEKEKPAAPKKPPSARTAKK